MRNVWTVYRREVGAYFNSPIAYIFIILFLVLLGFLFFVYGGFFGRENPDLRGYFGLFPVVLAVFIPAITMRLWAEEKRAGTIELLMTWPLRSWEVVVAKYLAAMTIVVVTLALTLSVPLSVAAVTTVDWGVVFASYVGGFVIASVYIALGAWVSTLTTNQVVALLLSVFLAVILVFLNHPRLIKPLNDWFSVGSFVGWFATSSHFEEFAKGLVNPVGLIYGLGLTSFFLVLNNLAVEARKF